jgi:hypothetical protein
LPALLIRSPLVVLSNLVARFPLLVLSLQMARLDGVALSFSVTHSIGLAHSRSMARSLMRSALLALSAHNGPLPVGDAVAKVGLSVDVARSRMHQIIVLGPHVRPILLILFLQSPQSN